MIADLKDWQADLKGDAVVGAVVENAKFKLVYRVMDPNTAEWVARMSGTILVDDEVRKANTGAVLTATIDSERSIRQAERFFTDSNMILNLPYFVSFIFTTKTLPSASLISPIRMKKRELEICAVSPAIAANAATRRDKAAAWHQPADYYKGDTVRTSCWKGFKHNIVKMQVGFVSEI